MDRDNILSVLRAHLGRNAIQVVAQRLNREPEEILDLLLHNLGALLDLTEDEDVTEAVFACLSARVDGV